MHNHGPYFTGAVRYSEVSSVEPDIYQTLFVYGKVGGYTFERQCWLFIELVALIIFRGISRPRLELQEEPEIEINSKSGNKLSRTYLPSVRISHINVRKLFERSFTRFLFHESSPRKSSVTLSIPVINTTIVRDIPRTLRPRRSP